MKLTKALIDKAAYPSGEQGRFVVWDSAFPGFGLRVYPSGRKAFILSYRHAGRKRLLTIGSYGSLTLENARNIARSKALEVTMGADPLEQRNRLRSGGTVRDLCDSYLENHARQHKKTWREDQRRINRTILPKLGSYKLVGLSRADIATLHQKIGATAPYEANRTLALLSKMFNFAISDGLVEPGFDNPARHTTKYAEKKRERWITQIEMPRLMSALDQVSNVYVRTAFLMYLLTGFRKMELLTARWDQVDIEGRVLTLPDTKSGKPLSHPLSSAAIELISKIPGVSDNPYIFPGKIAGRHLVNISKPWRRIRCIAGIEDVRLHDLRRTVGSWMAQSGASLHLIGRVLNQTSPKTTQIYAHLNQDVVREVVDLHSQKLMASRN